MLEWWMVLLVYLAVISLISAAVTVSDKKRARNNSWRVKEKTLFVLSGLGGAVAMLITMKLIRHKTQHNSFMIGIPLIIVAQIAVAAAVAVLLH